MDWKLGVEQNIRTHLEKQIGETIRHRKSYDNADNPANAQLWIAIANLSKEIFNLNLKISHLEKIINSKSEKIKKKDKPKKL